MSKPTVGTLAVYSQAFWHDPVMIVGDGPALAALRDAITGALERGYGESASFMTDGEGYSVYIALASDSELGALRAPYTDEVAQDHTGKEVAKLVAAKMHREAHE